MPAEKALIESITQHVLERLGALHVMERILILRDRNAGPEIRLPLGNGAVRRYLYQDETIPHIDYDRYILPRLELGDMADLAHGKPGSDNVTGVLELLLKGEKVEVIEFVHLAYEKTAPASLFELYRGYAEILKGFGLVPLCQPRKEARYTGKLLGESDIEQFHAKGITRIELTTKCLVTPLAEECARKFGIELQRDQRGA